MKWRSILELIFPRQCAVCGAFDQDLCEACAAKLEPSGFSCLFCGTENLDGRTCFFCKNMYALDGFTSSVSYHDPHTQTIMSAFKYRNHRGLTAPIAALMVRDGGPLGTSCMLLPLPLAAKRFRERGYNQAELLARELSKISSIPLCDSSPLEKIRHTPQQAKAKSREARFTQIENAFALRVESSSFIANKRVILVDDVTTSGATLNEAARVLKEGGARSVWGWVFAHG
jgi:ComF family protein